MSTITPRLRRHFHRFLHRVGFVPANQVARTRELAVRVATLARQLGGAPVEALPAERGDAIALLESACRLLDRQAHPRQRSDRQPRGHPAVQLEPPEPAPARPPTPPAAASPTISELIKIRDIVLAAADGAGGTAVPPALMQALYRKLGQILEREGVIAIEETGAFDAELQEAVETLETDDPARNEQVCATVRPGYLLRGRVLRPQQVTVYTLRR